jgi:DNA helicase-2/ATP-dependent DNA helicase PcrA
MVTISAEEWAQERARLKHVIGEAHYQLLEMREAVGRRKESVIDLRRSMWDEGPRLIRTFDDNVNAAQYLAAIRREETDYATIRRLERALERLTKTPYFARVDFRVDGETDVVQVYIGLATLIDHTDNTHLVFDWRAPISSVFYDFEPGPASYETSLGRVTGEMLLKRQYRIAGGELQYMFNTDVRVSDEILQEVLSKSADRKMSSIVTTIQREQNRIIREDANKVLVVQGPAGSGKTSVALHRVAFLLYRHRDTMSSESMVILSPNRIFADYISDVLPELGEENINQTTFHECAVKLLGDSREVQDMSQQLEYLLTNDEDSDPQYRVLVEGVRYKGSPQFVRVLRRYAKYLEETGIRLDDVVVNGETIATADELMELFRDRYVYLPIGKRLEKVYRRVLFLMQPREEERYKEVFQQIKDDPSQLHASEDEIRHLTLVQVRSEFGPEKARMRELTRVDAVELYRHLFEHPELIEQLSGEDGVPERLSDICRHTVAAIGQGRIRYEDVAPIAFVKVLVEGVDEFSHIRHVVLDEMQDYSPCHFEVIKLLFPKAGLTALGDLHQSVHPYASIDYETMLDILGRQKSTFVELTRSYRSTEQITRFTRAMLDDGDRIEFIAREGSKPLVTSVESEDALMRAVESRLRDLRTAGTESIAVICRTATDAQRVYERLRHVGQITLVTRRATAFETGAVVVPAYLAKGLEFDAVLIYNASDAVYNRKRELRLLYTACTRAMHQLYIYYTGHISPLLSRVDPELYDTAEAPAIDSGD